MNLAGFDRPKVCKKRILCLYSPSLKVHSTRLRFPELGKQRASKNSVYVVSLVVSGDFKEYELHKVQPLTVPVTDMDGR